MPITIISNYTDMFAELDRVFAMPTPGMRANLDAVLDIGFHGTQAVIHVDTGRLKASGKQSAKVVASEWTGQFSFPAVNKKGTTYGIYELARKGLKDGTPHDFFAGVGILKPLFKAAILKGFHRT